MNSKTINIYRKSIAVAFALFTCVGAVTFTCRAAVPIPGLVSYWAANGNGNDSADGNTAILQSGASFGPGISGQAFTFDGVNAYVKVPASANLNVGLGSGFTISTWVNPAKMTIQPLLEWNGLSGTYPWGSHMWISVNNPADLYANLVDTSGNNHYIESAGGFMTVNAWQQVALTYDEASGTAVLYRNGVAIQTENLGSFTPQTSYDLYMGIRPAGAFSENHFQGSLDETSIYNRALTPSEMLSVYQAVPEPGCAALICVGLVGFAGLSSLRKRA
jgi:hypothetical protein